jgi:hypothetical protein
MQYFVTLTTKPTKQNLDPRSTNVPMRVKIIMGAAHSVLSIMRAARTPQTAALVATLDIYDFFS